MPIRAPFWWVLGHISPNNVAHHRNPQKTVLGLSHVIFAMKREKEPPNFRPLSIVA